MKSSNLKKIFLLMIITCCTGCYVEYDLDISNYTITENIKILEREQDDSFSSLIDNTLNTHTSIYYSKNQNYFENNLSEGFEEYDKSLINYGINLNTYYTVSMYQNGTALNTCYNSVKYSDKYDISIKTSDEFLCLNKFKKTEYVKISIKTDYKVLNNNADEVLNDGTMVWVINKNNYKNHPIIINTEKGYNEDQISSSTRDPYDDPKSDEPSFDYILDDGKSIIDENDNTSSSEINNIKKGNNILLIVLLFLGVSSVVVIYIVYKKYKKHTK